MSRTAEREPLTTGRVIDAAMQLMDAEGLDAVSMRRLGRELGVEAMSLYNHVPGKDALLRGVLERVMAEFELPEGSSAGWAARLRAMAISFRDLLLRHPNALPLFAETRKPMTSAEALQPLEMAFEVLRGAGLSEQNAVHAYRTLVGYVMGNVLLEIGGFFDPGREWERSEELARVLSAEHFPRLAEMLPHLAQCDPSTEFAEGLDLIIAGLRARLG